MLFESKSNLDTVTRTDILVNNHKPFMEGNVTHSSSDDYSERIQSTRELELLTVLEEGLNTSPSHLSAF